MSKVYVSSASPYSCKVLMAALHAGIVVEAIATEASKEPAELLASNPLGKIPSMVTDEGEAIHDSRVIIQYLNRQSKGVLFPRNPQKRTEAEKLEALADGICDCLLAQVYERRFRPEDKVHQPWIDRQMVKVQRALDELNAAPPKLTGKVHAGHMALRATLAYMELRFPGQWAKSRTKLKRWAKKFDEKNAALVALLPA
ncbi:glutathione S-transferase [Mesorhizobium sp. NBSH29]|uniref:glutathione S-transferase family protein n=1 Tax=Mesorhizobium sp. NBSH29 TaxID=2654249 RepID=UPI0018967345|nr:glutathione S-transferase family protein [Mesorhizobium sp. NBSH29]QPC87338.1 glutathione S-transferase [Mesorhizobium sp. NBSH29]